MADDLTNQVPAGPHVEEPARPGTADLPKAPADRGSVSTSAEERHRGEAGQAAGKAESRERTLRENADRYVRENPTKAVLSALGIGFVCGLIFRR